VARVGEGQVLARSGATAMMDLSDGLAMDLARLCRASGVAARVRLAEVPVSGALLDGADVLGVDALRLAVSGGEDYELLATLDPPDVEPARRELREHYGVTLTSVGTIIEGSGLLAVDADGREAALEPTGWDHFA
jgi:thiamine-monophosphate kinase